MNIHGNEPTLLLRLLSAAGLRSKVIASNVANQNTPGYTRQEVLFEDLLRDSLDHGGDDLVAIEPRIVEDPTGSARPDGNNISLERELNAMRENRLLFETYSAILAGHFRMMETSITGGR